MSKQFVRTVAEIAAIAAIAVFAPHAGAVNLSANGLGQVLIYPYYTVNAGQQTLISVVNTTFVGKVVKVRFREAYNGRAVLDFNLYLSPADVWTAAVFALSDAGLSGDFAGILSDDHSCTDPPLNGSGMFPLGPAGYQAFSSGNYTGSAADSGPGTAARTREGHVEMILMSDVIPGSALYVDMAHVNSVPADCTAAVLQNAAGYAAPTLEPNTGTPATHADGGLFGAASIVDVAHGVFYAYSADALDGFSYRSLYTAPGAAQPTLASVNDRDDALHATAHLFIDGEAINATFPGSSAGSRAIDAVSAVFAANILFNEYVATVDGSIGTDWVVTFPTKHFYVDAQPGGTVIGAAVPFAPFVELFGATKPGASCALVASDRMHIFDREENTFADSCGFGICPPGPAAPALCLETNVIDFDPSGSARSVLGSSQLAPETAVHPFSSSGWWEMTLDASAHALHAASNGNVFHGLPLTGFAATRYTNNYVPIRGGGLAIGSYSGAWHHRITSDCANGNGTCK